jgi:hypothetical protein
MNKGLITVFRAPAVPGALAEPNALPQEAQRIGELAVHPHLEMEMDSRAGAGAPRTADQLPLCDPVALADESARKMCVHRHDSVLMAELDDEPVALEVAQPADGDYASGEGRVHPRVRPALDIDPLVEAPPAGPERRAEVAVQGDEEEIPFGDRGGRLRQSRPRRWSEDCRGDQARGRGPSDHGGGV